MKGVYTAKRKHGTAVLIDYTAPDGQRARERIETVKRGHNFASRVRAAKARAEQVLAKRQAAIVEGRYELPRPKRSMTFSRFVSEYYADHLRASGIRTAEVEIQRLSVGVIGQFFGEMQLADVNEWQIQKFKKMRQDEVAPASVNRDLARLSHVWNTAARMKLVTGLNPVREAGRLEEPEHRERYLTPEEARRLLGELREDVRRIVEVALHTGIRRGALLGLRWRDVNLETRVIRVPRELSKGKKAYAVGMSTRVHEILTEEASRGRFVEPDDFVFVKRDGSQRKSIRKVFEDARERAGLPGVRFHDLRHTAASWLIMAGATLYDVQKHLGHRSPQMTERYAHLSDDHMVRIAELAMPESAGDVVELREARRKR